MATPKKKGLPTRKQDGFIAEAKPKTDPLSEPSAPLLDPNKPSGIKKDTAETQAKATKDALVDLNNEIDANWKMAYDNEREFITAAKEDIEFRAGKQWTDQEKAVLQNQGRPCLTFNKIRGLIDLLAGHFIQNSNRIEVAPEGGEDETFSEVSDKIIDHLNEQSALEFNLGLQFAGGQTTGRTYLELDINYEKDPIFGDLKSFYHGRPGVIIPDPRGTSYDLNEDRQFCFKLFKSTKAELKSFYPDKADEIEQISSDTEDPGDQAPGVEGDKNNYGADKRKPAIGVSVTAGPTESSDALKQFHVKAYWRYIYVTKWFVYFADTGDLRFFKSEEEATAETERRKALFLEKGGDVAQWMTKMKKRQVREMHVAVRCGGVVLTDGLSPWEPYYTGYPFFQYIAKWIPEAEKSVDQFQGMVRGLKDPQREKNKARSQFLHIINTAANSGWIIDDDAMEPNRIDELKQFGSVPGIVLKVKTGKRVERIEPVAAPMSQAIREKAADDDFKEVSLINADLLAIDENKNPSGKAIALRIRQGLTVLEPDFRNFRRTKKLIGIAIMRMIPTMFDVAKMKKVLGVAFLKDNEIDDTFLKAFLIQMEDLKYVVRVAEQGDTKTLREETFEDLMQMLQHGVGLPFEVLADFMQLPNKAEVLKKVQAFQQTQQANALAVESAKRGGSAAPKQ